MGAGVGLGVAVGVGAVAAAVVVGLVVAPAPAALPPPAVVRGVSPVAAPIVVAPLRPGPAVPDPDEAVASASHATDERTSAATASRRTSEITSR